MCAIEHVFQDTLKYLSAHLLGAALGGFTVSWTGSSRLGPLKPHAGGDKKMGKEELGGTFVQKEERGKADGGPRRRGKERGREETKI